MILSYLCIWNSQFGTFPVLLLVIMITFRAKKWRLHSRQWRVKTDQGHQKLRFECPLCDYATEFRKDAT